MCTLSIIPCRGDLVITMNRDEQRDRHESGALFTEGGRCFPVDERSGGTWVGTNENGLTCALLNRYQDAHIQGEAQSRGDIIPMLLSCADLDDAVRQLQALPIERFNPFDCVVVCGHEILHATWNGQTLSVEKHGLSQPFFITSSSERTNEVIAHRTRIFSEFECQGVDALGILRELHLKRGNDSDESSILMRRALTHTKSITQIVLTPAAVELCYWTEGVIEQGLEAFEARAIKHIFSLSLDLQSCSA